MRRAALERVAFFWPLICCAQPLRLCLASQQRGLAWSCVCNRSGESPSGLQSPWRGPLTSGAHTKTMHTSQAKAPVLQAFFGQISTLLTTESPKPAEQNHPIRAKGTGINSYRPTAKTSPLQLYPSTQRRQRHQDILRPASNRGSEDHKHGAPDNDQKTQQSLHQYCTYANKIDFSDDK